MCVNFARGGLRLLERDSGGIVVRKHPSPLHGVNHTQIPSSPFLLPEFWVCVTCGSVFPMLLSPGLELHGWLCGIQCFNYHTTDWPARTFKAGKRA